PGERERSEVRRARRRGIDEGLSLGTARLVAERAHADRSDAHRDEACQTRPSSAVGGLSGSRLLLAGDAVVVPVALLVRVVEPGVDVGLVLGVAAGALVPGTGAGHAALVALVHLGA